MVAMQGVQLFYCSFFSFPLGSGRWSQPHEASRYQTGVLLIANVTIYLLHTECNSHN